MALNSMPTMPMNIVVQNGNACLLEPVQEPYPGWRIRPGTFRVFQPYDSASSTSVCQQSSSVTLTASESRPSKKQKLKRHSVHIQSDADKDTVRWIQSELESLLSHKRSQSLIRNMQHDYFYGNQVEAPANEAFALDLVKLQPTLRMLCTGFHSASARSSTAPDPEVVYSGINLDAGPERHILDLADIYETVVLNENAEISVFSLETEGQPRYLVPPKSARKRGGFDIIVMDPPWQNASVDRMAHYETMDLYDLFKIPIPELLRMKNTKDGEQETEGIVAVWITNRAKVKKVVIEKLFPAWGLELVAHWYWLKVTVKGEPVLSLDNTHRRAYEGILIGRRAAQQTQPRLSAPSTAGLPGTSRSLLVSVPSQHSRKPSLYELLEKEFFPLSAAPSNKVCPSDVTDSTQSPPTTCKPSQITLNRLELFARNLEEGVFAWGNEPIRYQYCGRGSGSTDFVQDGFMVPSHNTS